MFTCCGTPAVTPWRTRDTIHAISRTGWGTNRFSIRFATPSLVRRASRTFGEPDPVAHRCEAHGLGVHKCAGADLRESAFPRKRPSATAAQHVVMGQHATFCTAAKSRRGNPIISAPHPRHSRAGAGAIHSIDSRHALSPPGRPRSVLNKKTREKSLRRLQIK